MPPNNDGCPFEYKVSDWGRLPDGRLVALDYSADALSDPADLELAMRQALSDRADANVETKKREASAFVTAATIDALPAA
jgi:hypothetical protein